MSAAFLFGVVVCAAVAVVAAMTMLREVQRRGVEVHWPLLRLRFFGYLAEYRRLTLRETGRVGALHHLYVTSMLLALVFAVAGLVMAAR